MTWTPPRDLPVPDDVERAAKALEAIPGAIHHTPVLRSRILDELYGKQVFLKAENLQKVGAFKARGATYAVSRIDPKERARGIITYSSGNHAQAVAHAARIFGCKADVFMPVDAPAAKRAAVERYGAHVTLVGTTSDDRKQAALEASKRTGARVVEPFDDSDIMAGQGTAGLELFNEVPDLDAVYVPVGGGGLCSGIALAAQARSKRTRIIGVEPSAACSLAKSLEAGEPVSMQPGPTLADGLRPVRVGARPFAVLQAAGAQVQLVEDADLVEAMKDLMTYSKLVVEPSGAAGLAAVRKGPGDRVGVVLSGGNVDLDRLGALLLK